MKSDDYSLAYELLHVSWEELENYHEKIKVEQVHEYQELDIEILRAIAENEYKTLTEFCRECGVSIII